MPGFCLEFFIDYRIAKFSDTRRFDFNAVAGAQILRRVETCARTVGGAGRDYVAGFKAHEGRQITNEIAKGEQQVGRRIILSFLAIDGRAEFEVGVI